MNYYYDVLINLQDKYIYFYEWDSNDDILNLKKILIVNVSTNVYEDFFKNVICVNKSFLDKIANKCKLKNNNVIPYICIISDTKNAMVVEFDDNGKSICKSSLLLEDEVNVCELAFSVDRDKIDYYIMAKDKNNNLTVQEEKIKKIIKLEIKKCYEEKNYNKLKFIFLEWFNYLENDIKKLIDKMYKRLEYKLTENEYKVYKIIRMSYNKV